MIDIFSLLFPKSCYSCGKKITVGYICDECISELNIRTGVTIYNREIASEQDDYFSFDLAYAVFPMSEVIRNLIHNFKYSDLPKIGAILGGFAKDFIIKTRIFSDTDFVLPVPLHKVKKRIRGFNQSEILAKKISKGLKFKLMSDLVLRKKFTRTQTKLTRKQRQENVADAFAFNKKFNIEGKNILLVDDVFTTGSTADSISKVLRKNNPKKIYVLTIARA